MRGPHSYASLPVADVNGVRLHYEERGHGPVAVLVHGGLSDYTEWSDLVAHLSRFYRVVAYSRRNAYPNELRVDAPAGVAEHVADLAALLEALHTAPAQVVGESYGAVIALECARSRPDLVRALVVDEPALPSVLTSPEDRPLRASFETLLADVLAAVARHEPEVAVRTAIDYLEGAPGFYDGLPPGARESILRNVPAFQIEFSAGLPNVPASQFAGLRPPTLWMTSSNGSRSLARVTRLLAAASGNRAVEIPGTSHGSIIFAPAYHAAVEAFLRGHA